MQRLCDSQECYKKSCWPGLAWDDDMNVELDDYTPGHWRPATPVLLLVCSTSAEVSADMSMPRNLAKFFLPYFQG